MSRTSRRTPVELAPGPWPEVRSSDPVVEHARQFALGLRRAIRDETLRSVAARTGLSHVTLFNVLAGKVWPDLATIARLHLAFGATVRFWTVE